jgi:hypothetical protein
VPPRVRDRRAPTPAPGQANREDVTGLLLRS